MLNTSARASFQTSLTGFPRGGAFAEESAAVATSVVAEVVRPAHGEPVEPVVVLADQPADRLVVRYPEARHLTDTVPVFMRLVKADYARSSAHLSAIDSICSITSLIAAGCWSGG